ncbi:MAG: hypothetical protein WC632_04040 [Candidatus Margulisiibacteriota bacterium]
MSDIKEIRETSLKEALRGIKRIKDEAVKNIQEIKATAVKSIKDIKKEKKSGFNV